MNRCFVAELQKGSGTEVVERADSQSASDGEKGGRQGCVTKPGSGSPFWNRWEGQDISPKKPQPGMAGRPSGSFPWDGGNG